MTVQQDENVDRDSIAKLSCRELCIGAAPLAAIFIVFELLNAVRSSFWSTFLSTEWAAIGFGGLVYTVLLMLIALPVRKGLHWAGCSRPWTVWLPFTFASVVIWVVLVGLSGEPLGKNQYVIGGLLIGYGLCHPVALIRSRVAPEMMSFLVLSAAATGGSMLVAAGGALAYQIETRVGVAPMWALGWAVGTVVLLLLVWFALRPGPKRWAVTTIVLVAMLVLPGPLASLWYASPYFHSPGSRNLLLITCDTLRADYTSAYGGRVPTPGLAALASDGVRFDRAYALAPWTVPSMHGAFTSRFPVGLTPGADRAQWRREVTRYIFETPDATLAEQLGASGYATAAFVGNPLLGDPNGILRGMQHTVSYPAHGPRHRDAFTGLPKLRNLLALAWPSLRDLRQADTVRTQTEQALTFLRQHRDTPFFLWVHFIDPHSPYDPPEEFREQQGPWAVFSPLAPYWGTPQKRDDGTIDVAEADRAYVRHLYEAEIRYADSAVDRIMDTLDQLGLRDETFVCFGSDHGEELWDHGGYGHGQSLHDELLRVPWIMRGPGLKAGLSIAEPVSMLDMMPTFAALLGLERQPSWLGHSLAEVMRGGAASTRPPFARATNRYAWPETYEAVVDETRKLIRSTGSGHGAFYDLATDSRELNNYAGTDQDAVRELDSMLDAWRSAYPATFGDADAPSETDAKAMEELLQSMGYLD
jgi:arylsulfatase